MKETSSMLLIIVLFLCLPLVVVLTTFYLARMVKSRWAKGGLMALGSGLTLWIVFFLVVNMPYLWALHLESKWMVAHPKTRTEMESHLSLYSMREIQPAQSGWGSKHVLLEGDQMIQYMLFWTQPLEVVYDKNDRMIASYTSYE